MTWGLVINVTEWSSCSLLTLIRGLSSMVTHVLRPNLNACCLAAFTYSVIYGRYRSMTVQSTKSAIMDRIYLWVSQVEEYLYTPATDVRYLCSPAAIEGLLNFARLEASLPETAAVLRTYDFQRRSYGICRCSNILTLGFGRGQLAPGLFLDCEDWFVTNSKDVILLPTAYGQTYTFASVMLEDSTVLLRSVASGIYRLIMDAFPIAWHRLLTALPGFSFSKKEVKASFLSFFCWWHNCGAGEILHNFCRKHHPIPKSSLRWGKIDIWKLESTKRKLMTMIA